MQVPGGEVEALRVSYEGWPKHFDELKPMSDLRNHAGKQRAAQADACGRLRGSSRREGVGVDV